jgi:hypothetical protein
VDGGITFSLPPVLFLDIKFAADEAGFGKMYNWWCKQCRARVVADRRGLEGISRSLTVLPKVGQRFVVNMGAVGMKNGGLGGSRVLVERLQR